MTNLTSPDSNMGPRRWCLCRPPPILNPKIPGPVKRSAKSPKPQSSRGLCIVYLLKIDPATYLTTYCTIYRTQCFDARQDSRGDRQPFWRLGNQSRNFTNQTMTPLTQDVRFALRTLLRRRGFAAIAIATLALGIGAATSIYTVVDGILFRPLPFRDAARLAAVWQTFPSWKKDPILSRSWDK